MQLVLGLAGPVIGSYFGPFGALVGTLLTPTVGTLLGPTAKPPSDNEPADRPHTA